MQTTSTRVLGPAEGKAGFLGSIGVRFMLDGATTGGGFSLVEHPMSPRALAAPLHRHLREDEYSYVLEAAWERCSATTCSKPVLATSCSSRAANGTRSGTPATPPAASSRSSRPPASSASSQELVDLGGALEAEPSALAELCERYALEMDPASVPGLLERFGLRLGEPLAR